MPFTFIEMSGRRPVLRKLGPVMLALSLSACSSVSSPSSLVQEDYSDTLQAGGSAFKAFSVSKTGEMQVTLQALTPRLVVGFIQLGVGVQSGSVCAPMAGYVVGQAAVGQQYSLSQIVKGSYCVFVADASGVVIGAIDVERVGERHFFLRSEHDREAGLRRHECRRRRRAIAE